MGEGGNPLEDKEEASAEQRTDKGHKCVTELGGSVEFFWRRQDAVNKESPVKGSTPGRLAQQKL